MYFEKGKDPTGDATSFELHTNFVYCLVTVYTMYCYRKVDAHLLKKWNDLSCSWCDFTTFCIFV